MRSSYTTLILASCLLLPAAAQAADHPLETGKLVNVTTDENVHKGNSEKYAVFTVQVGDIIYTLRGEKVAPKAKDYAKGLIIGDSLQAQVNGEKVTLLEPNGKKLKTVVLKRERVQQ